MQVNAIISGMDIPHTKKVIRWKLAEFMDAREITRYALQKDSGVPMNTIRPMYAGTTTRVDFSVLDRVVRALRQRTKEDVQLHDILVWAPDGDA